MTKQKILEYARNAIDDAMTVMLDSNQNQDPWAAFYLGKVWACLSIALGGEEDD